MKKIIGLSALGSAGIFVFLLSSTQFCGEFDFINRQTRTKFGGSYCGFELPFMNVMYEVASPVRQSLPLRYYPQLTLYFFVIWLLVFAVIWFLKLKIGQRK